MSTSSNPPAKKDKDSIGSPEPKEEKETSKKNKDLMGLQKESEHQTGTEKLKTDKEIERKS